MSLGRGRIHLGMRGEGEASAYLEKKGYQIIERNYRSPLGEIDVIALDDPYLVFVEVRTRTSAAFGSPIESISFQKKRHLRKAALWYLLQHGPHWGPLRFDVVGILMRKGDKPLIELIQNAI